MTPEISIQDNHKTMIDIVKTKVTIDTVKTIEIQIVEVVLRLIDFLKGVEVRIRELRRIDIKIAEILTKTRDIKIADSKIQEVITPTRDIRNQTILDIATTTMIETDNLPTAVEITMIQFLEMTQEIQEPQIQDPRIPDIQKTQEVEVPTVEHQTQELL